MPTPTSSSTATLIRPAGSTAIDALLGSTKWGGGVGTGVSLSYSFPWASGNAVFSGPNGASYSLLNEPNATYHYGLNSAQQTAASAALQAWASVANISFQQVVDTVSSVGDIRFAWTSATDTTSTGELAWGWASYPDPTWPSGGDVWISTVSSGATNPNWSVGSSNYEALLHEIGHAVGMKHPFERTPVLSGAQGSTQYTVMSYTDHPHSLFVRVTSNPNGSFSWSSFNVQSDTPMLYDVAAIQYLYGANQSYRTGNDVYTFDPSTPFFRTIWDAGGSDTISVSNFTKGCLIDLRQGHFSKITIESDTSPPGVNWNSPPPTPTYDGTDNLAIAYGAVIENAIGGSGNDTLIGNDAANTLKGGPGNDTIDGGAGIDTIDGGAGIDAAVYAGTRGNFTTTNTASALTVADKTRAEGTDTLTNIERLQFSDKKLAFDMMGSAGNTAKILGAVFGKESVANTAYVGIGLQYLDGGMSYQDLMQLALNAKLGSGFSIADEVKLLYQNLVGTQPSSSDLSYWTGTVTSGQFTPASLAVMAADTGYNTTNINLVGLAQTGVEYV